jgi:hypothetical protein
VPGLYSVPLLIITHPPVGPYNGDPRGLGISYEQDTPVRLLPARPLVRRGRFESFLYRGTSPIRKRPPPSDPPWTLGKGLR